MASLRKQMSHLLTESSSSSSEEEKPRSISKPGPDCHKEASSSTEEEPIHHKERKHTGAIQKKRQVSPPSTQRGLEGSSKPSNPIPSHGKKKEKKKYRHYESSSSNNSPAMSSTARRERKKDKKGKRRQKRESSNSNSTEISLLSGEDERQAEMHRYQPMSSPERPTASTQRPEKSVSSKKEKKKKHKLHSLKRENLSVWSSSSSDDTKMDQKRKKEKLKSKGISKVKDFAKSSITTPLKKISNLLGNDKEETNSQETPRASTSRRESKPTSSPKKVLPTSLRRDIFHILESMTPPPGRTLTDDDIYRAGRLPLPEWTTLYSQVQDFAVLAKERQGFVFNTEDSKEREARRLLKSSWRASRRN